MTAQDSPLLRRTAPLWIFLVALFARLAPWSSVFWSGGVYPAGNDAYYHLRRIQFGVANFPSQLDFDPYLNFPHGARAIWTPVFDGVLSALGWLVVGAGEPARLEAVLLFVPPLLGAATAVAAFALARRFGGTAGPRSEPQPGEPQRREIAAWIAGLAVAVLPAAAFHSQLGFLDHHVAVALAAAGVLAAALFCAEAWTSRRTVALGAAMAAALLLWPGALLHVATAQAALALRALLRSDPDQVRRDLLHAAAASAIAAALVAPLAIPNASGWERWSPSSPLILGFFQPLWLLAVAAGLAAFAWTGGPRLALRARLAAAAVGSAAVGTVLLFATPLRSGASDAWSWLSAGERFQATVAESAPLFVHIGEWSVRDAEELYGRLVYGVPLALGWWIARSRPSTEPARGVDLVLWIWTLVFAIAAVAQYRFANSFALAYALLLARCLPAAYRATRDAARRKLPAAIGPLTPALLGALLLFLVWPALRGHAAHLANSLRSVRGEAPQYLGVARSHPLLGYVADWIRVGTPETAGYLDATLTARAEYGVLAPWTDGHLLRYRAERPMVQDNFGDDVAPQNVELSERYFASSSEAAGLAVLRELGARWVVVRPGGSGFATSYPRDALYTRLQLGRGSEGAPLEQADAGTPRTAEPALPALVQHRLHFETPPWPGFDVGQPVGVQVYEIVEGARIRGAASAGAPVRARITLDLIQQRGTRSTGWSTTTTAGADGCYTLELPHPTEHEAGNVVPRGPWVIESEGERSALRVPIEAVRSGDTLEGPDLRPDRERRGLPRDPATTSDETALPPDDEAASARCFSG